MNRFPSCSCVSLVLASLIVGGFHALTNAVEPLPANTQAYDSVAETEALIAKLDEPFALDVQNLTIDQIAGMLRKQLGASIDIDRQAFEETVFDVATTFTAKLDRRPLGVALRQLLGEHRLSFYVDDGVLTLTSKSAAENRHVIRVYPVVDLLVGGDGIYDLDSMVELLIMNIRPNYDDSNGQANWISYHRDRFLIIKQDEETQADVRKLLRKLRRAQNEEQKIAPKVAFDDKEFVRVVYPLHVLPPQEERERIAKSANSNFLKSLQPTISPEQTAELTKRVVRPTSWGENQASILAGPASLIVVQTRAAHEDVRKFLWEIDVFPGNYQRPRE